MLSSCGKKAPAPSQPPAPSVDDVKRIEAERKAAADKVQAELDAAREAATNAATQEEAQNTQTLDGADDVDIASLISNASDMKEWGQGVFGYQNISQPSIVNPAWESVAESGFNYVNDPCMNNTGCTMRQEAYQMYMNSSPQIGVNLFNSYYQASPNLLNCNMDFTNYFNGVVQNNWLERYLYAVVTVQLFDGVTGQEVGRTVYQENGMMPIVFYQAVQAFKREFLRYQQDSSLCYSPVIPTPPPGAVIGNTGSTIVTPIVPPTCGVGCGPGSTTICTTGGCQSRGGIQWQLDVGVGGYDMTGGSFTQYGIGFGIGGGF